MSLLQCFHRALLYLACSAGLMFASPVMASFWESLFRSELPVDQVTAPADSQRFEFVGVLPANTQLELVGYYASSICTRKEIRFPSGDLANPYRATLEETSVLRQVISSDSEASEFSLPLALNGGGDCQWHLEDLMLDVTILPNHPLWQRAKTLQRDYLAKLQGTSVDAAQLASQTALPTQVSSHDDFYLSHELNIDPIHAGSEADNSLLATTPLSLAPVYYPVFIHYPEEDKPFEARLKSSLQRTSSLWASPYTQAVRRGEEAVMRVNFNPQIAEHYEVDVWYQPDTVEVKYPDGTQYAYANSEVKLYAYGKPESQIKTLAQSAKAEDKRLLARIYELGHALPKDEAKAQEYYREAAEAGDIEALHWMLDQAGYVGRIDEKTYWLGRAASFGDNEAKLELIHLPLSAIERGLVNTGEDKVRETQAWQQLNQLVDQGLPEASSLMAFYQLLPYSPYFDANAALENYRLSVKAKPELAHAAASDYYYLADNFAAGEEFWQIAAERDLYAAAEFANILLSETHRDAVNARYWLARVTTLGAKQGLQADILGNAYFQLATLLDKGEGGAVDAKTALTLYQQSIEIAERFSNDYEARAKDRVQVLEEMRL
ncbi:Sel1 domain protein repeat-containing protein [Shewanella baltica OS183]|uniref:sel1 repeat family protein n=1 Tax=Shewanella baltica TaxID=62322 RepID=UPI0001E110A7|nr:sel1 repeat family protein [Shewanella baltica]AEG10000.1 Sel1 domain protein repeat-containing protein [Shewanella baltica BA175]EHQ16483.1 Sel1 domain protein repeat-containing protein [Shewanella baltica OS183]